MSGWDYSGDQGRASRPRTRKTKPPPPGQLGLFDPPPSPPPDPQRTYTGTHGWGPGNVFPDPPPTGPDFDGTTYDPLHDYHRLSTQLRDVWDRLTADPYRWWTLAGLREEIEILTDHHHTEAAISARLRDLRKPKFGRYTVQRKAEGGGLFRYRLDPAHYLARAARLG